MSNFIYKLNNLKIKYLGNIQDGEKEKVVRNDVKPRKSDKRAKACNSPLLT